MGIPANHPAVLAAAGNGLNPHLAGLLAKPKARPSLAVPDPDASRLTVSVWVPGLVPVSEANTGGRLPARLVRKAVVKGAVAEALGRLFLSPVRFPVRVTLHRVGVRTLDDDNLAHCFKAVRDVVAGWLGIDDGDTAQVAWMYLQERVPKGGEAGTRITIEEGGP